jgi:hypothetical protein
VFAGCDLESESVVAADRKAAQNNSATAKAGKRNMQISSRWTLFLRVAEKTLPLAKKNHRTENEQSAVR